MHARRFALPLLLPAASKQEGLLRLVTLEPAEGAVVEEDLHFVCRCGSDVPKLATSQQIERGELRVHDPVVPVRIHQVDGRLCRRISCYCCGKQAGEDIGSDQEVG